MTVLDVVKVAYYDLGVFCFLTRAFVENERTTEGVQASPVARSDSPSIDVAIRSASLARRPRATQMASVGRSMY